MRYFLGKKVEKKEKAYDFWDFKHDKFGKITSMLNYSIPDKIYYNHDGVSRFCRFKYDKKGLFRIYQEVGTNLNDFDGKVLIYERGKKIYTRRKKRRN